MLFRKATSTTAVNAWEKQQVVVKTGTERGEEMTAPPRDGFRCPGRGAASGREGFRAERSGAPLAAPLPAGPSSRPPSSIPFGLLSFSGTSRALCPPDGRASAAAHPRCPPSHLHGEPLPPPGRLFVADSPEPPPGLGALRPVLPRAAGGRKGPGAARPRRRGRTAGGGGLIPAEQRCRGKKTANNTLIEFCGNLASRYQNTHL